MRKFLLPAVLVGTLAISSAAMAATVHTTDGVIKTLDAKACTVALANKDVFHVLGKCDFGKLEVGEKVAVTWHIHHKLDYATKIVRIA